MNLYEDFYNDVSKELDDAIIYMNKFIKGIETIDDNTIDDVMDGLNTHETSEGNKEYVKFLYDGKETCKWMHDSSEWIFGHAFNKSSNQIIRYLDKFIMIVMITRDFVYRKYNPDSSIDEEIRDLLYFEYNGNFYPRDLYETAENQMYIDRFYLVTIISIQLFVKFLKNSCIPFRCGLTTYSLNDPESDCETDEENKLYVSLYKYSYGQNISPLLSLLIKYALISICSPDGEYENNSDELSKENRNNNIPFIPHDDGTYAGICRLYSVFFKFFINERYVLEIDERVRPLFNEVYKCNDENNYYKYTILTGMLSTCLEGTYTRGGYILDDFASLYMKNYRSVKLTQAYQSLLDPIKKIQSSYGKSDPNTYVKMKTSFPNLFETVLKYYLLACDEFGELLKVSEQQPSICSIIHGECAKTFTTLRKNISNFVQRIKIYTGVNNFNQLTCKDEKLKNEVSDLTKKIDNLESKMSENSPLKEKLEYLMKEANISDEDLNRNLNLFSDDQLIKDYVNIITSYYNINHPIDEKIYDLPAHTAYFLIRGNWADPLEEIPCSRLFNIVNFIILLKTYYKMEICELEKNCKTICITGSCVKDYYNASVNERLEFDSHGGHAYNIVILDITMDEIMGTVNNKITDNEYYKELHDKFDELKLTNSMKFIDGPYHNIYLYYLMYEIYKNHDTIFDSENDIFPKNMSMDDLLVKEFNLKDTVYPDNCLFMEQQEVCKKVFPSIFKSVLADWTIDYICYCYPLAFILFDTLKLKKIWVIADINVEHMFTHSLIDALMISEESRGYFINGIIDDSFYFHGELMTYKNYVSDEEPKKMIGSMIKNNESESCFTNKILLFMLYLLLMITLIIVLIITTRTIINTNKTIYET